MPMQALLSPMPEPERHAHRRATSRGRLHGGAWVLAILAVLLGYWLLPIQGRVLILTDPERRLSDVWPQVWVEPSTARPGEDVTLYVRDNAPWPYVKLVVGGMEARRDEAFAAGDGPWTWRWRFPAPAAPGAAAIFYHDCHTGCVEHARVVLGAPAVPSAPTTAPIPTKLGAVFADPGRDWHGRAAWTVELLYTEQADGADFGTDALARRIAAATGRGLRVLVRVAYDQGQSLPPLNDEVALARYLDVCARLTRDDRLHDVYAFLVGSGFNTAGENMRAPERPATPEWYARVFNGYGLTPERSDNVVQRMRAADPRVRIFVGPVTPWNMDGNGTLPDPLDVPWLNYFNTLVARIDAAVHAKSTAGFPLVGPDGVALQAPGRPTALEVAENPAREPATDVYRPEWGAAEAGFRVYRDWLRIVNRYPTTRGLPAVISSTNTWTVDLEVPPAQNYPRGWLTTALAEINGEPQVMALCWFVDEARGALWREFSLRESRGRLNDAAKEFDRLLRE